MRGEGLRSSGGSVLATRVAAVGSLVIAVVVVAVLLLSGGSSYTLRANFADAGGLVSGNLVLMGPATVGTVQSIGLTPNGQAYPFSAHERMFGQAGFGSIRLHELPPSPERVVTAVR